MFSYQDFVKVQDNEQAKKEFVNQVIAQHKSTELYRMAEIADQYDKQQNVTITNYRKLLYTLTGEAVPDMWSANHKTASGYFNRFVTQQNQYLLGNGTTWTQDKTAEKLGDDFDFKLQQAGQKALVMGVSFGFFNYDHLEVFSVLEFAPLYDEENGALMAGVRFWQIDNDKPLRATLYELDGYTDYVWNTKDSDKADGTILHEKRDYIEILKGTEADGTEIYDGKNYPSFPIIPLWGNPHRQSELVGLREEIDAYDLICSGFCNDLDDASQIYWTLSNSGGMDDIDLVKFVERMKVVKAAVLDDQAQAQAHTLEVPYNAREAILDRLEKQLYKDYMALNTEIIAGGAITATQIKAAYEPMDAKANMYEYCIKDFIQGILLVAGIEDAPTFTRSKLVNVQEEVQTVLQAAQYLDADYVTKKILTLLGDSDQIDEVLKNMDIESMNRFNQAASDDGEEI